MGTTPPQGGLVWGGDLAGPRWPSTWLLAVYDGLHRRLKTDLGLHQARGGGVSLCPSRATTHLTCLSNSGCKHSTQGRWLVVTPPDAWLPPRLTLTVCGVSRQLMKHSCSGNLILPCPPEDRDTWIFFFSALRHRPAASLHLSLGRLAGDFNFLSFPYLCFLNLHTEHPLHFRQSEKAGGD